MTTNNTPLKVILAITKGNAGGAQRYVCDMATSLAERGGYEVSVLMGSEGSTLAAQLENEDIPVHRIQEFKRDVRLTREIKGFFRLFSFLRKERPDVFHINSSKMGALGALVARCARVPRIIFTAHGWAHGESWRPRYQRVLIRWLHWLTIQLSHHTIAVSREVKNQMASSTTKHKIHTIPLGITEPVFISRSRARRALTKETHVEETIPLIGTIAELHPNKGLSYLIEALAGRKDTAHLVIIGEGEERDKLKTCIDRHGLADRVHLVGFLPNASSYLKALDIFVLPSLKEGFPYTLLEAGYAELPVIATSVGGVPEIIHDLKTGLLVRPGNTHELGRALELSLKHPEESQVRARELRAYVHETFSRETMIQETCKLYATAR